MPDMKDIGIDSNSLAEGAMMKTMAPGRKLPVSNPRNTDGRTLTKSQRGSID